MTSFVESSRSLDPNLTSQAYPDQPLKFVDEIDWHDTTKVPFFSWKWILHSTWINVASLHELNYGLPNV
jgi:hypothetical protein